MLADMERHPSGSSMQLDALAPPCLPNELADIVLAHCHRETLFLCSLVSRYWAFSSRSHLFASIVLRPVSSETAELCSVLASPHNTISRSIRRLHFDSFSSRDREFDFIPVVKALADAGAAQTITLLTFRRIWYLGTIREIPTVLPHVRCVGWGSPSPLSLVQLLPWLREFKQLDAVGSLPLSGKIWPRDPSTEDPSWSTDPDTLLVTKLVMNDSLASLPRGNQPISVRTPNLSSLHVAVTDARTFDWELYQSFLRQNASTLKEVQMTFYRTQPPGETITVHQPYLGLQGLRLDITELIHLQTLSLIFHHRIINGSQVQAVLSSIPHTLKHLSLVFHRLHPLSLFQSQDDPSFPIPSLNPSRLPSLSKFEICVPPRSMEQILPIQALWPKWRDADVLVLRSAANQDDGHRML